MSNSNINTHPYTGSLPGDIVDKFDDRVMRLEYLLEMTKGTGDTEHDIGAKQLVFDLHETKKSKTTTGNAAQSLIERAILFKSDSARYAHEAVLGKIRDTKSALAIASRLCTGDFDWKLIEGKMTMRPCAENL
ncbi:hypothetical protein DOTSEDRAFT_36727 [Dothistroma septosporum NZE10]|uniref:Uncharacterized protein n=1 Tax=Dothistroma septosporum (strain NZE10 / CBS 128990) TaxID=675120 RepID=N1PIE8_DOTSN|nr:hypothetical protein DOTSEDRAFT_36727 [Dothistroma septosporum NZE10]